MGSINQEGHTSSQWQQQGLRDGCSPSANAALAAEQQHHLPAYTWLRVWWRTVQLLYPLCHVLISLDAHQPSKPDPHSCHVPWSSFSLVWNMSKGSLWSSTGSRLSWSASLPKTKKQRKTFKEDQIERFYSQRLLGEAAAPCSPQSAAASRYPSSASRPSGQLKSSWIFSPDLVGMRPAAKQKASAKE